MQAKTVSHTVDSINEDLRGEILKRNIYRGYREYLHVIWADSMMCGDLDWMVLDPSENSISPRVTTD